MASTATISLTPIPFHSKVDNFRIWKLKFESYLLSLNLQDEIKNVKSENERNRDRVKVLMLLSLDQSTLLSVPDLQSCSPHQLLNHLTETHQRTTTASKFHLKSKLLKEQLQPNDSITDLIKRINETAEQLKTIASAPSDDDLLFTLINALSSRPEYNAISTALSVTDSLTFAKACQSVLDYEVSHPTERTDHVNFVKFPKSDTHCNYCKRSGHSIDDCDFKNKRCFKCHKRGHQAKECTESEKAEFKETQSNSNRLSYAGTVVDRPMFTI